MAYALAQIEEGRQKATVLPLLDCNARCPFCSTRVYTDEGVLSPEDYQAGDIDVRAKHYGQTLDEVKHTYDSLVASGVNHINLQGGEPTMWEPLPEILRYGRQLGVRRQEIVSNGRRFKDATYTGALLDAEPDTIVLSLFGATASVHDESMGVRGAFDDVVQGVQNLVAGTKARAQGRTSLMAQFSLHARNFRELPAMVRFWYGLGLRDFYIRLLRETLNTKLHPEEDWFFDLVELKEPLAEALDWLQAQGDAVVFFSEIFYCLLWPSHFAYVLRDLGGNPNLQGKSLAVSKRRSSELADRHALGYGGEVCDECDLNTACLRMERFYRHRFSGELKAVHVAEEIRRVIAQPLSPSEALRLQPLLGIEQRLDEFGLTAPEVDRLWRAVTRASVDTLPALVLPGTGRDQLRRSLEPHRGRPVAVRMLKLSELPGKGPLRGDRREILSRLAREATPEARRQLEFLADKAECLVSAPMVMVFGYVRRAPRETLTLVPIYDDARLEEESIFHLLAPFVEAIRSH